MMSKLYPKLQTGGLFQTNQKAYSDSVLLANKDKDWVKRLYEKNTPKIYINGDNVPSTHYMGDNGKGYVFPTIVRENGILKNLNDSTSFTPEQYARKTNTGIQLPVKQGSWFAANGYKKGTGVLNEFQEGGTLSQLGYKRHSPYNKASSLLIHTPTGSITMKEVDHPILGIGHNEIKFMIPNKEYQFKSNKVLEIPMKTMYPKKYQQGGTTPEMSSEQQQEIVKRVRNLRKTIGYNKTQGVPLDGIAFRHALHVNKHLIKQEDQELLSAFDENQILKLMNDVPDEEQPMYKKGGRIGTKSKMYPKCKCGCGGVTIKAVKAFSGGGELKEGATEAVRDYQEMLNKKTGSSLKTDGIWGQETQKAYEKFLKSESKSFVKNSPLSPKTQISNFDLKNPLRTSQTKVSLLDKSPREQFNKEFGKGFIFGNPNIVTMFDDISKEKAVKIRDTFINLNKEKSLIRNDKALGEFNTNQKIVNLFHNAYKSDDFNHQLAYSKKTQEEKAKVDWEQLQQKKQRDLNNAYLKSLSVPDTFSGGTPAIDLLKQDSLQQTKDLIEFNKTFKIFTNQDEIRRRKMKLQQGGTMDVLDGDGNSQMTITGGERIFSRIATKKMLQLNEEGRYKELGKFICDELYAQDKRDPQYVKE